MTPDGFMGTHLWTTIGVWLAVGLTLMMFSFLYKDNPFFKFGEALYLGISNGYWIIYVWQQVVIPDLVQNITAQRWSYLIPALLSLFMLMRLLPAYAWISRWALGFYVGWGSGAAIPANVATFLLAQIVPTLRPMITYAEPGKTTIKNTLAIPLGADTGYWLTGKDINTILIMIGVVCVIIYFFFSVEHKGIYQPASTLGIWILMIAFGAAFGSTVMARVSLLIGRIQYLFEEGISPKFGYPTYYQIGILILIIIFALFLYRSRGGPKEGEATA